MFDRVLRIVLHRLRSITNLRRFGYLARRSGLAGATSTERPSRILVYSPVPWTMGRFELGIGLALRARGHEVMTLICGGGFSACECENAKTLRPACSSCINMALDQQNPFGFVPTRLNEYLDASDWQRAKRAAEAWNGRGLSEYVFEGMPVGLNVARYLHNYYQAFTPDTAFDAGHLQNARRCLESSVLYFLAARRVLSSEAPSIVIMSNGKNLVYFPFFYHSQSFGLRCVTWDELVVFDDSVVMNSDCFANEIHLEDVWQKWSSRPLSDAEDQALSSFTSRRREGDVGLTAVQHGAEEDVASDLISRGWSGARDAPLVAVFPNVAWDTAVIGRDLGFSSLLHWLSELVQVARDQPKWTVVIRAHPHESRLPTHFSTATPIPVLLETLGDVPSNVIVVPSQSALNSYALGAMATSRVLYTGNLGLEFAVGNLSSIVCGDVHYRGKGFTLDAESPEHLRALLEDSGLLDEGQQALARKYMYLFVFRHILRLGGIGHGKRELPDDWFKNLAPGASYYWESVLDAVLGTRSFDFGSHEQWRISEHS